MDSTHPIDQPPNFYELCYQIDRLAHKYTRVSRQWSVNQPDIAQSTKAALLEIYRDFDTPLHAALTHPSRPTDPEYGYRQVRKLLFRCVKHATVHRREIAISQLLDPQTAASLPVGEYWCFVDEPKYRPPSSKRERLLQRFRKRLREVLDPLEMDVLERLHVTGYTAEMVAFVLGLTEKEVIEIDKRVREGLRTALSGFAPETPTVVED